ncbi:hypothetical protein NCLIV_062740 [Neospora caninum Liverpool]|uniref:Uncharacterized protein n=1 Tax=Neospora caninum (strain Liverpool) TaxID=572307 RepID=F0VQ51_NEOCL|nr:hypothetical protein NCLIV_062740 [Neospora caninum Liverpool]CBZ55848.1 hypothetical protein NCLIV_062740 [Neospora caninum Liverpool]CEL70592.1 TPA: hypothetical protein BN1204_062740 [Neospora caninum Liverpool]|eukprot:XP_003885874.1 hypothetical protein NCLIV_062740 [Neospora caninum Liverpool]
MDGPYYAYGNVLTTSHQATMNNAEKPLEPATILSQYVPRAFTTPTRPRASLITAEELESYLHLKQPLQAYLQSAGLDSEASSLQLQDFAPSSKHMLHSSGGVIAPTPAAKKDETTKKQKRHRSFCCCRVHDE